MHPLLLLLLLPSLPWGARWALAMSDQLEPKPQMLRPVTVQEGLCAFVPCSFTPRNYRLHGSWFLEEADWRQDSPVATSKLGLQEGAQGRFSFLGDPKRGNCSLRIRDVQRGDSGKYFFVIESYRKYAEKQLSLNVTALTHRPQLLIPGALQSGHPRNLTCSVPWACEWGTPPLFSWTSAALASLGPRTSFSSVLSLTPGPQDHGTHLTCQVTFPGVGVTVETTVQLSVAYAPQNMAIYVFQGNSTAFRTLGNASSLVVPGGQVLRLLCEADSNPPANLSWFRGPPAPNATPIASSATLELSAVGTPDAGELSCLAQHPLGSELVSLNLLVQYTPQLPGPSCSQENEGLRCSCASSARPAPSLCWRLGEQLLEGNSSDASFQVTAMGGSWASSSLSLRGELSSDLSLSCEALNPHGTQSAALLLLPAQGVPGSAEPGAHRVQDVLGGAAVAALLCLGLYLLLRVKGGTCKERAAWPAQSLDAANSVGDPHSRAYQHQFLWLEPPAGLSATPEPASREEQDLHYAFLRFHKPGPPKPGGSNTLYSEVRAHV